MKLGIFCVVINPKTKSLLVAQSSPRHGFVDLTDAYSRVVATGSLDIIAQDWPDTEIQTSTGMQRAHTSPGVLVKGKGYGTALYTALSVYSMLLHVIPESEVYDQGDAGVFSPDDTTPSPTAKQWWRRALAVGLVEKKSSARRASEIVIADKELDNVVERQLLQPAKGRYTLDSYTLTCKVKAGVPPYYAYSFESAMDHHLVPMIFVDRKASIMDLSAGSMMKSMIDREAILAAAPGLAALGGGEHAGWTNRKLIQLCMQALAVSGSSESEIVAFAQRVRGEIAVSQEEDNRAERAWDRIGDL